MSNFIINSYVFGGAPPFSPINLNGIVNWLDMSDVSTIFQDTAKTTPVTSDNDPVGAIVDKINGANFIQASAIIQPKYRDSSNGQNGNSIIFFDGNDILIDGADDAVTWSSASYAYVFLACQDTSHTSGDATHVAVYVGRNTGGNTRLTIQTRLNSTSVFRGANRRTTETLNGISSTSNGNWNILTYIVNWTTGATELRVNGVQTSTGTNLDTGITDNVTSIQRAIGGLAISDTTANGNFDFIGNIGEVIIGNGNLSATEISDTETYLISKWGI
jgi:hypothetical protein